MQIKCCRLLSLYSIEDLSGVPEDPLGLASRNFPAASGQPLVLEACTQAASEASTGANRSTGMEWPSVCRRCSPHRGGGMLLEHPELAFL